MKSLKKINKRYGKLSVLSEDTVDGRRTALVQCSCGQQKRVMVDALTAGRTRSCGRYECKYGKAKRVKGYTPTGSRTLPLGKIQEAWDLTTRLVDRKTTPEASKRLRVPVHRVYAVIRSVRRAGGIDQYMKAVGAPG
jgi:hypothetical protein